MSSPPSTPLLSPDQTTSPPPEEDHSSEGDVEQDPQIYDLVIIGAGPASLALCARLCEQTPAALFTDEEHRRYHWIKSSLTTSARASAKKKNAKTGNRLVTRLPPPTPPASPRSGSLSSLGRASSAKGQWLGQHYHTLVLDSSVSSNTSEARFMARWSRLFEALSIPHLRSPMFFHLDPSDRDSLLAYAHEPSADGGSCRYATDCIEIGGVVGRELSKHTRKRRQQRRRFASSQTDTQINERDRSDYRVPSSALFADHCRDVIDRYQLDEQRLLRPAEVVKIDYGQASTLVNSETCEVANVDPQTDCLFCIDCTRGTSIFARAVVCATGAGPGLASMHGGQTRPRWPIGATCHSSQLKPGDIPGAAVRKRIALKQPTSVVVVGGGLTSAQLVNLLLERGVNHVWLLLRRNCLRVKPFDVDLEWMGKYRNGEKASFWSADGDDERLQMVREARGGGSVPAPWAKRLKSWESQGRLTICTNCDIEDIRPAETNTDCQRWRVTASPYTEKFDAVDYVYFATGPTGLKDMYVQDSEKPMAEERISIPPFLQTMQERHPMTWLGGLPALTDDLAWCSSSDGHGEIPLYVTGALAALRLGPGAANLEGARLGAERIAWALERLPWAKERSNCNASSSMSVTEASHGDYVRGVGGRYGSLGDEES